MKWHKWGACEYVAQGDDFKAKVWRCDERGWEFEIFYVDAGAAIGWDKTFAGAKARVAEIIEQRRGRRASGMEKT